MRRIREICSWKAYELAKIYYKEGRIINIALERDGTLSGTFIENDQYRRCHLGDGDFARYLAEHPPGDLHVTMSLHTGRWHCSCPYSQVHICSHVATLMMCAAKDMDATVPADNLPAHRRSKQRTTLPYCEKA